MKALTQTELDNDLKLLNGWEPVESLIPGDNPKSRQELRKLMFLSRFGPPFNS